jgi:Co/Zn/Cd efflux system component
VSTHAGALLLAALAYTFARNRAGDPNFTFGTGKFGDLAGFSSALVLAMIALLIAYESVSRLFAPVTIHFAEAIPIACLGFVVNIASAWLLSSDGHHHGHSHGHAHERHDHDEAHHISTGSGIVVLQLFEDGVPPRFRLMLACLDTEIAEVADFAAGTVFPPFVRALHSTRNGLGRGPVLQPSCRRGAFLPPHAV